MKHPDEVRGRWLRSLAWCPLALALTAGAARAQGAVPAEAALSTATPAGVVAPAAAAALRPKTDRRAPAVPKAPTGRVAGVVVDGATGEPLVGAQIAVQGLPLGNVADDAGAYFVNNVPAGPQTLSVEYLGYDTQALTLDVRPAVENALDVSLFPTPLAMEEVVVEEESVTDLSEYVEKTAPPSLAVAPLRPVEVEEPDTTLMEAWHRSMREMVLIHAIEYPMTGARVYFRRAAPKRSPMPAPADTAKTGTTK